MVIVFGLPGGGCCVDPLSSLGVWGWYNVATQPFFLLIYADIYCTVKCRVFCLSLFGSWRDLLNVNLQNNAASPTVNKTVVEHNETAVSYSSPIFGLKNGIGLTLLLVVGFVWRMVSFTNTVCLQLMSHNFANSQKKVH